MTATLCSISFLLISLKAGSNKSECNLLSIKFPCQQVLRELCKSGIPSSYNVWGGGSSGGGAPHHPHGHSRWVRGGGRGLQEAAQAQQGDQRQLGQAFDPEQGSKDNPLPSITAWIQVSLVTSESTSKGDADVTSGIGSRIIHQSLPSDQSNHQMQPVPQISSRSDCFQNWIYTVNVILVVIVRTFDDKKGRMSSMFLKRSWHWQSDATDQMIDHLLSPVISLSGSNQLCKREF